MTENMQSNRIHNGSEASKGNHPHKETHNLHNGKDGSVGVGKYTEGSHEPEDSIDMRPGEGESNGSSSMTPTNEGSGPN